MMRGAASGTMLKVLWVLDAMSRIMSVREGGRRDCFS